MPPPLDAWRIAAEPHYRAAGDEIERFEAAFGERRPVLLEGPSGCGKTRFVAFMAWRLRRPLFTVTGAEGLRDTPQPDGPLARAARHGGIGHLVGWAGPHAGAEAAALLQALADARREPRLGGPAAARPLHPDFALVLSCRPGQLPLPPAARRLCCPLRLAYPNAETETAVVMQESGIGLATAASLVALGTRFRRLSGEGLVDGASTRMLVRAAMLIRAGASPLEACRVAMVAPLTDDRDLAEALTATLEASF